MSDQAGEEKDRLDKDTMLTEAAMAAAGTEAGVGDLPSYLHAYFRHVAVEDLAPAGPARVAEVAIEQARFAAHRPQGRALVRVGPGAAIDPARDVISIVTDDMPFLVDSLRMELSRHDLTPRLIVHPQLRVKRDVTGGLREVLGIVDSGRADHDEIAESWTYIEITRLDDDERAGLVADLQRVLGDVRVAVEDYPRMQAKAVLLADELAASDAGQPLIRRVTSRTPRSRRCCAGWPMIISPSSATANTTWTSARTGCACAPSPAPGWASCGTTSRARARSRRCPRRYAPGPGSASA